MEPTSIDFLNAELEWVFTTIHSRISSFIEASEAIDLPPPEATKSSSELSGYAKTVHRFSLQKEERLVLALALAPHVRPALLDPFCAKNALYDREFTEWGGVMGTQHAGFLPTGETALFLLAGEDLELRSSFTRLFDEDHIFVKEGILFLDPPPPGEPHLAGRLRLSDSYAEYLLTGRFPQPRFSSEFPATRLTTRLEFKDLVLRPHSREQLEDILVWINRGREAIENSSFGRRFSPGFKSLFYGPPGTGKTLAVALLGKAAEREVFRIDLASIVSKWVGETEKNLARVFDRARGHDWILFFDEADALFGKRSETKQSQDRYANQEVAYLLQRIEEHSGVVLMATNKRDHIDSAFLRRFHSVIHFPLPNEDERLHLWQDALAEGFPVNQKVDLQEIARDFEISGGLIMNAIRHATLKAISEKQESIQLSQLMKGLSLEMDKYGLQSII